jgi:hypothetical protein
MRFRTGTTSVKNPVNGNKFRISNSKFYLLLTFTNVISFHWNQKRAPKSCETIPLSPKLPLICTIVSFISAASLFSLRIGDIKENVIGDGDGVQWAAISANLILVKDQLTNKRFFTISLFFPTHRCFIF